MRLKTASRLILGIATLITLTGCITLGINVMEVKQGEKAVVYADIYRVVSTLPGITDKRAFPEKFRFERIDGPKSLFSGITEVEHSAPTTIVPGTYGIYSIGIYGASSNPYIATFTANPGDVLYLGSYELQPNEKSPLGFKLIERPDMEDARQELAKEDRQLADMVRHHPLKIAPGIQ